MSRATGRARRARSVREEVRKMGVEDAAQHVFVAAPRVLRFAHRDVTSLRHPYLALVAQRTQSVYSTRRARTHALLELLVDHAGEVGKWARAAAVFDLKMDSDVLDAARQALLRSASVTACLERLWRLALQVQQQQRNNNTTRLDTCDALLGEDAYTRVHQCWYGELLQCSEVTTITLRSIAADYAYDVGRSSSSDDGSSGSVARGVSFASFCLAMLEVADNWTSTRSADDYAQLLRRLVDALAPLTTTTVTAARSDVRDDDVLPAHAYYSGGVLTHRSGAYVKHTCT